MEQRMRVFLAVLLALAMLGVVGFLAAGMIGLVRGGGDPERSNRLMRWRVIMQAGAIILFLLLMMLLRS
jgi:hypothetical protein